MINFGVLPDPRRGIGSHLNTSSRCTQRMGMPGEHITAPNPFLANEMIETQQIHAHHTPQLAYVKVKREFV